MSDSVIKVENLSKKYVLGHQAGGGGRFKYKRFSDALTETITAPFRAWKKNALVDSAREEFWALKDVSFEIKKGESVGIIGRNGAGKSTLLKILSRITEPSAGRIEISGRVSSLLEVGTGFHPELTGRENIFLNGAILGMQRAEIKKKFDEIVAFAEVEKFLDTPVKHFSSGMYMRLAFAVAAHLDSEILVVDEVLAVGDADFQKKCLGKMQSVSTQEGRTVLFVSHNMQAIRQMCERVIFLKQGKLINIGDAHTAISAYMGQGEDAKAAAIYDLSNHPRGFSTEEARFTGLRFLDQDGKLAPTVRLNDVLTVEVDLTIYKQLKEFNISMAVVHGEGLRVFSEAYSDQYVPTSLEVGNRVVRFHVPMRFFKMESYFLSVTIVDNGRHCDSVGGLLMPEIVNENPNIQMETHRWGVVRIPVSWDPISSLPSS